MTETCSTEELLVLLDAYCDRELSDDEIRRVERCLRDSPYAARIYRFESAWREGVRTKLHAVRAPASLRERVLGPLRGGG